MSEALVETPINIDPNINNSNTTLMGIESNNSNGNGNGNGNGNSDNSTATSTTNTTATTTSKTTLNNKPKDKKSTSISSTILTRGKKRAKETYDFMFGVIEKEDLLTLFGFECTGPNDAELRVYFHGFPKQDSSVITKQDLEKFINGTYTSDQVKAIDVDQVLKNLDLDESGEIEINDFVEYLEESIVEKSKSMGLIIELSSDEEKPKKKRTIRKPVVSYSKAKKSLKLKGSTKKKVSKTKEKAATSTKSTKSTKSTELAKPTKTTKVKYNFEKYHNTTASSNTEDLLESGATNSLGEGASAMWQYQFNSQWLPYDEDAAVLVEEAYQEWLTNPYVDVRSVKSGSWCYQVDFKQMTQTNIQHQDHKSRSIRRILKTN